MEHNGKNRKPYSGIWASVLMMVFVPTILYFLLEKGFARWLSDFPKQLNHITCCIVASGIGLLFDGSCWLVGAFKEPFQAVKTRMSNFVVNCKVSFRYALKEYGRDMKSDGVEFLIYIFIILFHLTVCIVEVVQVVAFLETM
jgi:hypothetical protein